MKTYFLTTPLYYVNSVPHIGHAYTTIAADILARWKRMQGNNVYFLTGTDEHGAKIAQAAEEKGANPQAFVNSVAAEYKKMWDVLNISFDDFIQTTEDRHKKVVQAVFEKLNKSGAIYKGSYEGWYCIHDESYFAESELVDKKCPSCGREVQKLKEESYFFKLSEYEDRLLAYYKEHPEFLSPKSRSNEIINFVNSGLRDLSVSRTRVKWGIPVQSDPNHTIYVWFEALQNYISAPGYSPENPTADFKQRWPADVHLVGKEIYRFHAVIWPAMLMALDLPLPKKVFAHGWWTVEGTKMSKSLGNVVDPKQMSEEYGIDAFRYFLMREVNFGSDGDFSEKALLQRYNSELANNLGNLLSRTVTIIVKNLDGIIPALNKKPELIPNAEEMMTKIDQLYDELKFGDILDIGYQLLLKTNQFIDEKAPWKLGKDQKEALSEILYECLCTLKFLAIILHPFMPTKTQTLWERLGERGSLESQREFKAQFSEGQTVVKGDPLFMRKGGRWK